MGIVNLNKDAKIFFEDREYIIKGYASLEKVLLKNIQKPFDEKIVRVSELIKNPKNSENIQREQIDLEDKELAVAVQRYEIIETLIKKEKTTNKDIEDVAIKHNKSTATIRRWLKKYKSVGSTSGLATSYYRSGAKGRPRLSSTVNTLIDSIIEEFYLNNQQYPLEFIYQKLQNECTNLGIETPHKETLRNRINNVDPKLIAKYRRGEDVRETRGMPGKHPDVAMPLDVIQIDHTKVDIQLVDETTRQVIGRPYITVAIDIYSRMIHGFYISLEAPSFFSVGQCLYQAILPKDELLQRLNIIGEYPIYGLPKEIRVDNGKDFWSDTLKRFCEEYMIKQEFRPVGRSHFGGHIERVIKTCMKNIHQLPGSTFSNISEKGKYDSEKMATMTIDELEQWFCEFVVNIYHKTEHSALFMTPEEKFYQGMLGVGEEKNIPFLPSVPHNTIKLRLSLLPSFERTVQKNGITVDYVTYFSETLRKWIVPTQIRKLKQKANKVICRRDPRDISKLYVYDPDIQDYIIVPYADIKRPPLNIKELRKAISEAKKEVTGREIESYHVFEAHDRLQKIEEKSKREKKSIRRNASSKKHLERTRQDEKTSLEKDSHYEKYENKSRHAFTNLAEDDEDESYEYYPVE